MTRVTVDAGLSRKLHGLTEVAELCDPSGRVLGRFVPVVDISEWEPVTPDVSEEELDRREKSDQWYTFDEVMAHLKRLEKK
jgi:hypothetical protein